MGGGLRTAVAPALLLVVIADTERAAEEGPACAEPPDQLEPVDSAAMTPEPEVEPELHEITLIPEHAQTG